MDTAPDPRPDLTAAQRIAIALGTAPDPRADRLLPDAVDPGDPLAAAIEVLPADEPAPGPPA